MYSGLRYRLSLEFPAGYPYQPPRVKFLTSCFHPNVDNQGFICLDILKDKWSALYDVRSILLSIQSLLGGNQSTRSTPLCRSQLDWKRGCPTSRGRRCILTALVSSSQCQRTQSCLTSVRCPFKSARCC